MKITLVTGNIEKWKIAKEIFAKYNIILEQEEMETPEIQSINVEDVSLYSAKYALDKLQKNILKSDVGYYIEALNGFPGPYVKDINSVLESEDILNMMKNKTNRKIILKECITLIGPNLEKKQFTNLDLATISYEAQGEGTTFDKIVVLKGEKHPKAMNTLEQNRNYFIENTKIYHDIAKYILKENI